MRRKIIAAAAVALLVFALALSCGKDNDQCIRCIAVCNGVQRDEMRDCGEDILERKEAFIAANPGCTVTCEPQ